MTELCHHGILGMKWGVRRYQNKDGSLTSAGKKRYGKVFVSGSSKTEFADSGYYRPTLPKPITDELDSIMADGKTVLVGDAPGIDRQVQNYLQAKGYKNVEVYGPGKEKVRYSANPKWKSSTVDNPDAEPGSSEWLAAKDEVMSSLADEGLAVILDNGSSATRANIKRLAGNGKSVKVYELDAAGSEKDRWLYDIDSVVKHSDELVLRHHGILGMKWGVRRYQNTDGSLTAAGRRRYGSGDIPKGDIRWAKRNQKKIEKAARRASQQELSEYSRELLHQPGARKADGRLSAATINAYNRRMAQVMSQKVSDLRSPSGRTIQFVAKRGSMGVHMALADVGYDMDQLRNGVWDSGRIAYRKKTLDKA